MRVYPFADGHAHRPKCHAENTMNLCTPLVRSAFALSVALALAGCSSSSSPSAATTVVGAAVSVPVLITDAPSDQLLTFSITLNSITLTDSAGKTASILPTPTTVEICHLNGIQAPLLTASVPADTYTSAVITFSNPEITYISSTGTPVVASPTLATTSYTVNFASPITISSSSTSLLVDLLASQSVTISGTTVTVNPVFKVTPVAASSTTPMQGQYGTGMDARGAVVSASGTTLVIQPVSGANITFITDTSTEYDGVSGLSTLTAGELVEVSFTVQTGGTLLAKNIELKDASSAASNANILTGPITSIGSGSFNMALMEEMGKGISSSSTGAIYAITANSSTTYGIAPQFQSLSGLPFTPAFSATTMKPGQNVTVTASALSTTASTATAASITLAPQTLSGTVASVASVGGYTAYNLTLTPGSAFATLSGASSVTVYTNSNTVSMNATAIAAGSTVRFNGLVFYTGSGYAMVAGCSPDGTAGH